MVWKKGNDVPRPSLDTSYYNTTNCNVKVEVLCIRQQKTENMGTAGFRLSNLQCLQILFLLYELQNEDSICFSLYMLFASCCVGIKKVHNLTIYATILNKIISLHISTPLGHLQVLTIIFNYFPYWLQLSNSREWYNHSRRKIIKYNR
jgi:hypothetical protein